MDKNIIETALEAATEPHIIETNGRFLIAKPHGNGSWDITQPDDLQTNPPIHPQGTVSLHDTNSFVRYTQAHAMAGTQVAINADFKNGDIKVVAILDGHHGTTAGWNDWRAQFSPKLTSDAAAWLTFNKQKCGQSNFASFLSNHVHNIVSTNPDNTSIKYPAAAEVLDFATNLEVMKTLKFKKGFREQDGTIQFEFKEENNASTERQLKAFEKFSISFQPYLNGTAYFVEASLKFRTDNNTGEISLWYELKNIEKVFEIATKDIANEIEAALGSNIPVYYGSF